MSRVKFLKCYMVNADFKYNHVFCYKPVELHVFYDENLKHYTVLENHNFSFKQLDINFVCLDWFDCYKLCEMLNHLKSDPNQIKSIADMMKIEITKIKLCFFDPSKIFLKNWVTINKI